MEAGKPFLKRPRSANCKISLNCCDLQWFIVTSRFTIKSYIMEKKQHTIRYGIYSFVGIALFFLLMKLCGLENVTFLRVFNLVIVVFMANRLAKLNLKENPDLDYFQALASLFISNVITVVLSIAGFALYTKFVDTAFLTHFKGGILWNGNITLQEALAALFLEGMAGSIMVSFIVMQYWKDAKSKKQQPLRVHKP